MPWNYTSEVLVIMQLLPPTYIIRHRKENLKKCSLRGLENREDICFFTYPFSSLPPLNQHVMLVMEGAPVLSAQDMEKGILLLDSTWRYLPKMLEAVERFSPVDKRCLPGVFATAYPRTQSDCIDPRRGLSSLEALYIAYFITGRPTEGLLDNYYWKTAFIENNRKHFDY